jgi:hypothetical protein
MKILSLSKTGLILGRLYLAVILACGIGAQFITDPKGKFIVLQIPVVLPHGLLLALDATEFLNGLSWPAVYFVLGTPMWLLLVLLGNLMETIVKNMMTS